MNGELMLLHQGAAAFELWTGQPAPLDVMRERMEAAASGADAAGGGAGAGPGRGAEEPVGTAGDAA
jgi:shikimate dehydrogenase